jgi:hypothetical protein
MRTEWCGVSETVGPPFMALHGLRRLPWDVTDGPSGSCWRALSSSPCFARDVLRH